MAARAPNWSLKTRVLHCTRPLASCVTLGKPQHLSVPVAASQAQGCDEVGDCYSGCFCNSELVCHSCPEPSLPNWEARYPHSTPPPSIQVPTSVHNHSQLEWSTCLGVFSYENSNFTNIRPLDASLKSLLLCSYIYCFCFLPIFQSY